MVAAKFYYFTTGLYFSVLQFSYFLFLQLNISSTYVTYMAIVMAWMLGTIAGLWWTRWSERTLGIVGFVAYYCVLLFVSQVPLAMWVLPVASIGVFFSGLWAGHFFISYFKKVPETDVLFFHENNGFLFGIVLTFFGFVYLGKFFFMFAPIVCAVQLYGFQLAMQMDSESSRT